MKKIALAGSLLIAPALVHAQASVQAQSQAQVGGSASVSGGKGATASSGKAATSAQGSTAASSSSGASAGSERQLGADARSTIAANLRTARERKLPEEPIRERVAEGQAKGASDAQVAAASSRTLVQLEGAFDAMVRGGHANPSDAEVSRGASLLARGYTSVQLEAVARKAPSDRSLTVAFDALSALQANGVSATSAVVQLEGQLAAHATDAQLRGLTTSVAATAGVTGALGVGSVAGSTAGSAAGSAATQGIAGSAAAGAGAAATGALGTAAGGVHATGGVTGAVGGVLGKP